MSNTRQHRLGAAIATLALAAGMTLLTVTPANAAPAGSFAALQTLFSAGTSAELSGDIIAPADELALAAGSTATLDLAGNDLDLHSVSIGAGSTLTIVDSIGGGALTSDASDLPFAAYADARAGIHVPATAALIINSGIVNATGGGQGSSGIGAQGHGGFAAGVGSITINGGTVTATAGSVAAGIGSAAVMTGGTVVITGGTVVATGGSAGAGIGGAFFSSFGDITISGGTVTATSNNLAAAIGGGSEAVSVGAITISGGTVNASTIGGSTGAAIGSGTSGTGGPVTISGGTVTAAALSGAGIGSGANAPSMAVTITGGTIDSSATLGAGIGSGVGSGAGTISISAPASVTATSTSGGAGIGGGLFAPSSQIDITGGTVTATATGGGAGIGGGLTGAFGITNISGGVVVATSNTNAPGIGPGVAAPAGGAITVGAGADVTVGSNDFFTALGSSSAAVTINGIVRLPAGFIESPTTASFTVGTTGRILGAGELRGTALVTNNGAIALPTVTATDVAVNNYLVTFGTAGPEVRVYATTFTDGARSFPADPTQAGSVFLGWFTQPTGGTQLTTSSLLSADVTVYARFGLPPTGSSPQPIGAIALALLLAGFGLVAARRIRSAF